MSVSRAYDPVFNRYANELPTAYVRSLAQRESSMDPSNRGTSAWGILQVVEVVRKDFNSRNNTGYIRNDLLKADVCTMIACDLLNRILRAYRSRHGHPNLKTNWDNPRFVELLTFGWNAGYSEAGGVGHVATYLESHRMDVTIDTVHAMAGAAGASDTLKSAAKVSWCKSVSKLYFDERDDGLITIPQGEEPIVQEDESDRSVDFATIAAAGAAAWGIWKFV